MKKLMFISIVCMFIACSKNDSQMSSFLACDDLSEKFKNYNGEEIDCQFYYTLTEYNNQQFIELNSRCARLARPFVINENCVDICESDSSDPNSACGEYLKNREVLEILLIEK